MTYLPGRLYKRYRNPGRTPGLLEGHLRRWWPSPFVPGL